MILVDARRLTGPNLFERVPLVIVEVQFEGVDETLARVQGAYISELARMRSALGLPILTRSTQWVHKKGAVIAYEGAIDIMLALAEMSEWAALSAAEILADRTALALEPKRAEIEAMLAEQRSPRLLALQEEAKRRNLPFLWDDDAVSIGHGAFAETWSRSGSDDEALPRVEDVKWDSLKAIPTALITGTNGKTTSSRLLAHIARVAGYRVGNTSSDAILIGSASSVETIDTGDCTGPFAARAVLRNKNVDFAVLETARGGILRRGLAIDSCDVALITNVSEDHTGGYGIDDLEAMTHVKAVVARAATKTVVLNARDPNLAKLAPSLEQQVVFFDVEKDKLPIPLSEIPITFGGAAKHNVANALAVVAMARALGIPEEAIAGGLRTFTTKDNPGRGEIHEKNGVRVMLDFGHNPEGIRAVLALVRSLQCGKGSGGGGRLTIIAGAPGDRQEHEVDEMSRVIAEANPDRILVRDLKDYLRGRAPGEMPDMFRRLLAKHGYANAVEDVASEAAGLALVFTQSSVLGPPVLQEDRGDFVVILVHLDREEVLNFLAS